MASPSNGRGADTVAGARLSPNRNMARTGKDKASGEVDTPRPDNAISHGHGRCDRQSHRLSMHETEERQQGPGQREG
jgi:hypothetical protein